MGGDAEIPGLDPDALARAEAALSALGDAYLAWAQEDVAKLVRCLERLSAAPIQPRRELAEMFAVAHDMKGQAATFGYSLWGEVASRLCLMVETCLGKDGCAGFEHIALHVIALNRLIASGIKGDGGEDGRLILAELDAPSVPPLPHGGEHPID